LFRWWWSDVTTVPAGVVTSGWPCVHRCVDIVLCGAWAWKGFIAVATVHMSEVGSVRHGCKSVGERTLCCMMLMYWFIDGTHGMFWCSLHQCIWWFQWLCAQRLLCERTVSALTCVTVETGAHGGRRRPAYWPAWSERGPRWVRVLPVGECGCTCVVCSRQHLSFQKPVGVLDAKPSILVFLWCLMWLRFCACIWPCAYVQGRKKKTGRFQQPFWHGIHNPWENMMWCQW